MQAKDKEIVCGHCGFSIKKGELDRVCSNCFACTGCEIYLCPGCENEMVVRPIGTPRKRNLIQRDSEQ